MSLLSGENAACGSSGRLRNLRYWPLPTDPAINLVKLGLKRLDGPFYRSFANSGEKCGLGAERREARIMHGINVDEDHSDSMGHDRRYEGKATPAVSGTPKG